MTFHRFAYKVCWKNRVTVPLVLSLCTLLLIGLLLRDTQIEVHRGGRIRLKYYVAGSPIPVVPDSTPPAVFLHRRPAHQDLLQPIGRVDGKQEVDVVWRENRAEIVLAENKTDGDVFSSRSVDGEVVNKPAKLHKLDKELNEVLRADDADKPKDKTHRRKKGRSRLKFVPTWAKSLYHNTSDPPELFKTWRTYEEKFCHGDFVGYFNEFAHVKDLKLDKKFCVSSRKGGEKLSNVLKQSEEAEYFTYDVGCFQQVCKERPSYYFNNNNHMNDWLYSLKTHKVNTDNVDLVQRQFVLAIVRYEYVNFYHTMSDWYNAFLMMQFFNKTQWDTNILLVDAHPQGSLDSSWLVLFNSTHRISTLPKQTLFTDIVWSMIGYNSPLLDHYGPGLPLAEQFRDFFLRSFNVADRHVLNCTALNVIFIWRRDYVAHPRNPSGTISRKVENERELMTSLQGKYPAWRVSGIQIDLFDMQKQLNLVTNTDILIGMHGAGLTHALFLPKHAGLIELIPNYWSAANDHFYAIAQWRRLHYERWVNEDPHNEVSDNFTNVPVSVLLDLVKSTLAGICYSDR